MVKKWINVEVENFMRKITIRTCISIFVFVHSFAFAGLDGAYQAREARGSGTSFSNIITGIIILLSIMLAYKLIQVAFNAVIDAIHKWEIQKEVEINKNNIFVFIINSYEGDSEESKYTVRYKTKGTNYKAILYYKNRESVISSINSTINMRKIRGVDLGYVVQDNTGDFHELTNKY